MINEIIMKNGQSAGGIIFTPLTYSRQVSLHGASDDIQKLLMASPLHTSLTSLNLIS